MEGVVRLTWLLFFALVSFGALVFARQLQERHVRLLRLVECPPRIILFASGKGWLWIIRIAALLTLCMSVLSLIQQTC